MNSTDPIADMLTRIRNALMRGHVRVSIPYSQIKHQIVKIFLQYKFIAGLKVEGEGRYKAIVVTLTDEKLPISPITALERLSKPGRRVYVGWRTVPRVKNGRGLVILSTNKGLMTGGAARRASLGGEVVCSIY
ncbi:30S ribosomal protein S8 [Candidatus Saccharibacteria bacterium]|nr:30S ribosomal protein S8 [Candidatus Saccharibacteria bacterium]